MSGRTQVVFWGAVAAAVFLLGGGVSSFRSVLAGRGPEAVVLLVLSALGLASTLLVAARIVLVGARLQRRGRER